MNARIALLGLALVTCSIAFVPNAAAACEPLTDPDFCTGTIRPTVDNAIDRAGDLVDRIEDIVPERCWWSDPGIWCE